jgi:hypothetical protein
MQEHHSLNFARNTNLRSLSLRMGKISLLGRIPEIISSITSTLLTDIELDVHVTKVDSIDRLEGERLSLILSKPQFANLHTVSILCSCWPAQTYKNWMNKFREDMSILDDRGILGVCLYSIGHRPRSR